jgi:hypothetical protein
MKSVTIKVEVELMFALSLYRSPTGEGLSPFSCGRRGQGDEGKLFGTGRGGVVGDRKNKDAMERQETQPA